MPTVVVVAGAEDAVTAAVEELAAAQEAMAGARRGVTRAVVAAWRSGVSMARLGELSGLGAMGVRNLLDAAGARERHGD